MSQSVDIAKSNSSQPGLLFVVFRCPAPEFCHIPGDSLIRNHLAGSVAIIECFGGSTPVRAVFQ